MPDSGARESARAAARRLLLLACRGRPGEVLSRGAAVLGEALCQAVDLMAIGAPLSADSLSADPGRKIRRMKHLPVRPHGTGIRVIVVASPRRPRPDGCDLYLAAVRTMPRTVPGWKWNEQIRELGPPLELHLKRLAWSDRGEWPEARWEEYRAAYLAWMAQDPCALLITHLERRIRNGERLALGCSCDPPIYCHAGLLAQELATRCALGISYRW